MTREEEIKQAANDYLQSEGLQCNFTEDNFAAGVFEGIIAGAKWADEHPKNPWISVKDRLPEKINKFMSEPVLCRYTRGSKEYFHVCQYDFEFNEWPISNVTHWMPIQI